jgi:hypothetical protein
MPLNRLLSLYTKEVFQDFYPDSLGRLIHQGLPSRFDVRPWAAEIVRFMSSSHILRSLTALISYWELKSCIILAYCIAI